MKRYIYIIIGVVACLSSCTFKTEPKNEEQDTAVIDYSGYDSSIDATYPMEQTKQSTSESSVVTSPAPVYMDKAEDAYEEGRALGEEDRLNGTRSHEGDYDDDEDYDEDYDDGYGEEE